MAATVKSTILDEGKALVNGALIGYSRFAPHSFKLGSGAGHEVDKTRTAVVGSLVFTGEAGLISARSINEETVRYTMTVPEGVGPFSFGSVILYAVAFDGVALPFVEIALPFAVRKELADPDLNNETPFPKPGSRLIITVILKHKVVENDAEIINVTIVAPAFSNMAVFDSNITLPAPELQPWSHFVLHNHTGSGTPALVAKRSDMTYWAMPFLRNLHHPQFGVISGGVQGDDYQTTQHGWLWGNTYTRPAEDYRGRIGGYGYTTVVVSPLQIGGNSY